MARALQASNLFLVLALLTLPWPLRAQEQPRKIIVAGAQSITPLAEKFSTQFRKEHPGVEVEIRRANSNYAVEAVRNGQIQIGLVTRSLSSAEKANLRVETVGRDAIILLSYPRNTVPGLTLEQLQRIYVGKITNWREVGGEDKGIVPMTRENGSALHGSFVERLFGKGFGGQEKAFILRANKDKVLRTIKRVRGSLGYGIVRMEEAQAQEVKVLAVDGKLPTTANLAQGSYPFTREQLVIANGRANGAIREWMAEFAKFSHRHAEAEALQ